MYTIYDIKYITDRLMKRPVLLLFILTIPVLAVDQMAKTKTVKASALLIEQPESNYFGDLLGVLNEEELIRLRRRLEKTGKLRTAEVLADEIRKRF
jgi:hypothetical protein